jgi:hypothetical protein
MSINERVPQAYLLRYDMWTSPNFVICKPRMRDQYGPFIDDDFHKTGTRYDSRSINARLVTAAQLGDVVLAEYNLFPNTNFSKDREIPNLQKLIDKAYEVMSPEAREARQKRIEEKKAAAK